MNGSFFDDEEEIELRPKRKVRRSDAGVVDGAQDRSIEKPKRRKDDDDLMPERPRRRKAGMEVREMRDPDGLSADSDIVKYVVLALLVILVAVFTVKSLQITGLSILVIVMIQVILVLMGALLRRTPVFVPLLIAAAILLVGIFTGNTEIVLCGNATFLATVLTLKS